ncbi:MAG: nucleotidyltransferase [Planctomycetaceae bacterium]|nr:nucleotidyltransferase [Planctomycetaceae bacterium]
MAGSAATTFSRRGVPAGSLAANSDANSHSAARVSFSSSRRHPMAAMLHDLDFPGLARWGAERVPAALFWTVSGSHLYGFPSVDSDIDLRGCFLAPLRSVIGLKSPPETVEPKGVLAGLEVEAVSHEVGKYLRLLCKHNGYVLEQIFSPLVVSGADFLARLRPLATQCVTRHCYHHYRGFLQTQRKLMQKEPVVRAKTLLYAYRVAMTGVHLLETGTVESHLPTLNERFGLSYIPELVARKVDAEATPLTGTDAAFHHSELDGWEQRLDQAFAGSKLPDDAPVDLLNEFVVELRLERS